MSFTHIIHFVVTFRNHKMDSREKSAMLLKMTAGAVLLFAGFGVFRPDRALDVASGYVSHSLCSGVFVSGLEPQQIRNEQLLPITGIRLLDWAIRYKIDRQRREVTTKVAGMYMSRAVYHEGFGCMLIHGEEPVFLQKPLVEDHVLAEDDSAIAESANPQMRTALDHAFAEPIHGPLRQTKAV